MVHCYKGLSAILLLFLLIGFQDLANGGTPVYQTTVGKIPPEIPAGVRDSLLIPLIRLQPEFPTLGKKANIKSVVWLRITVGAKGKVEHAEVISCLQPGFGFEQAAIDAAKEGLFRPAWQGPAPQKYIGYYPVPFQNPDQSYWPRWHQEYVGIGLDAPLIDPTVSTNLEYPPEALKFLREGTVTLRILVNHHGKVSTSKVLSCSAPDFGFEKAAQQALKKASFPIYSPEDRATNYSAYTQVGFRLPLDFLKQAGYPGPDDSNPLDLTPSLLYDSPQNYPPDAQLGKIEGTVQIAALVDTNGRVLTALARGSSGFSILDTAAVTNAEMRQYKSAQFQGSKRASWVTYPVTFKLTSNYPYSGRGPNSMDSLGPIPTPEVLPRFTHFEKSIYPKVVSSAGITGRVKLAALIGENGRLMTSYIIVGSGNSDLDSAAVMSVPKHAFAPGLTNGKPVKSWMSWSVQFAPGSSEVVREEDIPLNDSVLFPQVVTSSDPKIPDAVRTAGLEGTVSVGAKIGVYGEILSSWIEKSSGSPVLDSLALANLLTFKFRPAVYQGKPIESTFRQKMEFKAKI